MNAFEFAIRIFGLVFELTLKWLLVIIEWFLLKIYQWRWSLILLMLAYILWELSP